MGLEILLCSFFGKLSVAPEPSSEEGLPPHRRTSEAPRGDLQCHSFGGHIDIRVPTACQALPPEHGLSSTPTQVLPRNPERFAHDEGTLGLILSSLLGNIVLGHCGYSPENNFSHRGLLLN